MTTILIHVTEEWNHMFQSSEFHPYTRRIFQRYPGRDDFVTYSEPYSKICGEPVWFYSWGNARWLRCPIGIPGDRLNAGSDYISSVDIIKRRDRWYFAVGTIRRRNP